MQNLGLIVNQPTAATFQTNLALGKTTWQSSTDWGYVAGLAVDGIANTNIFESDCAQTTWQFFPWWVVDLGAEYHVTSVAIANCCRK